MADETSRVGGEALPDDDRLLRFLCDLHAHLPESDRPMGWSDFSDEQAARARKAFAALASPQAGASDPTPALTRERFDLAVSESNFWGFALKWSNAEIGECGAFADQAENALFEALAPPLTPATGWGGNGPGRDGGPGGGR